MQQTFSTVSTAPVTCLVPEHHSPSISRRQLMSLAVASATSLINTNTCASEDGAFPLKKSSSILNDLTLVVPYPAAGPLDLIARKITGQIQGMGPVQVLNVTADGGAAGPAMVSRAGTRTPLLLMGSVETLILLPWLNPQSSYDPLKNFQPLTLVAHMPHVLVMRSELALQQRIYGPDDLLRQISRNRQPLRYASTGKGSIGHLAGQWFQSLTQAPLQHLPFSGNKPALSAVLEGSADVMFDNIVSSLPHIRAGRLKAIGVTSSKPSPALPHVPCMGSSVPGFNLTTWFGIFATAGITDALSWHWSDALAQTLKKSDLGQYLNAMGVIQDDLRLQHFAQFVRQEYNHYGKLLKACHLL